jgi:general stress protein 26
MTGKSLSDIAEKMRAIDIAILSTRTDDGSIAGRPMSNNRDVDYDGDSYYFACDDTRLVHDIEREPKVALSFQGKAGLLGVRPFFVAVEGEAQLVRDKGLFADHWNSDLDKWFDDGIETPGLVMVKVHAGRVHYWDGAEEGEVGL